MSIGLSGIWGFPITPFDSSGVDTAALERLTLHQVAGGVDVIVAAGALAEVDRLAPDEWRAVVETVTRAVAGSVPVVVGVPLALGAAAGDAVAALPGVAALLVMPGDADADAVVAGALDLAAAAGRGTILYQVGAVRYGERHLHSLAAAGALVGLKDGTGDMRHFRRLRHAFPEIVFAAAWEDLTLPYRALGADAFCPASTVHDPAYARRWLDALEANRVDEARRLLERFAYPFTDLRLGRAGISVSTVKEAARARGLPAGAIRAPAAELTAAEADRVRRLLAELDATSTMPRAPSPRAG